LYVYRWFVPAKHERTKPANTVPIYLLPIFPYADEWAFFVKTFSKKPEIFPQRRMGFQAKNKGVLYIKEEAVATLSTRFWAYHPTAGITPAFANSLTLLFEVTT
jgi:hypothetical protein